MGTLLPSEADHIACQLTNERVRVTADERGVYLVVVEIGEKIHLLPYQLTETGIERAIDEFYVRTTAQHRQD